VSCSCAPGARWSASGSLFSPNEPLGVFNVSDAFVIDTGPRSRGLAFLGGPAATAQFFVRNATGLLIATATLATSMQVPVVVVIVPSIPAFCDLILYAPTVADINLISFSLTLAPL